MYYVIQCFDDYSNGRTFKKGEVVSRHKEYTAALKSARSSRLIVELVEDLAIGDIRLDVLEENERQLKEKRHIDLAIDVIKSHQNGEKSTDYILCSVADEGYLLNEFMEKYGEKAQIERNACAISLL